MRRLSAASSPRRSACRSAASVLASAFKRVAAGALAAGMRRRTRRDSVGKGGAVGGQGGLEQTLIQRALLGAHERGGGGDELSGGARAAFVELALELDEAGELEEVDAALRAAGAFVSGELALHAGDL